VVEQQAAVKTSKESNLLDALVIGAGPAGLAIAAYLGGKGLRVAGLAPKPPQAPWPNTYGIWCDELEPLGLTHLLSHRWKDCVMYAGTMEIALHRDYGLLDKAKLQEHFLQGGDRAQVQWHLGTAREIQHDTHHAQITTTEGQTFAARIVVDASGHKPALVQRPAQDQVAYQAAYGIVGRFSAPPIAPQRFVLMDYRSDHLSVEDRIQPPTFLYAMDLGEDVYFVEETSLAACPAVSFEELERRLHLRLAAQGVSVTEVHHVEHCLFPMNLALPDLEQPVVGFGGAASMVHPASGYMVGSLLRRGPALAGAIAQALESNLSPQETAQAAWNALWPRERVRKHDLYLFGLENLMQFSETELQHFFAAFFHLPRPDWAGFLADTLPMPDLVRAMVGLFGKATPDVRLRLMQGAWRDRHLLWRVLV
jgi:lycopene cyclase-like protein